MSSCGTAPAGPSQASCAGPALPCPQPEPNSTPFSLHAPPINHLAGSDHCLSLAVLALAQPQPVCVEAGEGMGPGHNHRAHCVLGGLPKLYCCHVYPRVLLLVPYLYDMVSPLLLPEVLQVECLTGITAIQGVNYWLCCIVCLS